MKIRLLLILAMLFALVAIAFASGVPDPAADPGGFVAAVLAAFASKAYVLGACLVVIGGVFIARKVAPDKLGGDRAGAILALVSGLATALGGAAMAGALSAATIVDALIVGVGLAAGAAGLRQLVRRLIWPQQGDPGVKL
jgi:hypothetical protein